ncbi:MAG: thiamine pyrophosphate-binding protein, partial [Alphaproteobacteria bacterium]|nr:thiamine pyrophosphate-binding protein [Alphaproteobacteria bacterium]
MTAAKTSFLNWFAGRMAVAGLRHAFGVPGGGTSLDLLHALRENDIQSVITAREDAAVIMAGVSGLLAEAPGLAFSTRGPGLASAANGLASAALDRLPALLVSEAFGEDELEFLSHQVLSQSDLIKPLLEKGEGVELPADQGAVEAWLNGPKNTPAVMFPTSSQFKHQVLADKPEINNPHLPDTNMTDAKKLLQQAQRPVLVVGLEAARASTTSALRTFVEALGAPILCTYMAKGCVPDDDAHFAGVFTGGSIEQACLNEADLIILIGLDPVEVISKPWAYTAPVLDLCERVYDPHYLKPTARIVAPLSVSLSAFADCLQETTYKTTYSITWQKSEITKLKSDFDQGMEEGGSAELSSAAVVKSIRDCFPARPRLCVDAGAHMFSACAFWPARAPHDL